MTQIQPVFAQSLFLSLNIQFAGSHQHHDAVILWMSRQYEIYKNTAKTKKGSVVEPIGVRCKSEVVIETLLAYFSLFFEEALKSKMYALESKRDGQEYMPQVTVRAIIGSMDEMVDALRGWHILRNESEHQWHKIQDAAEAMLSMTEILSDFKSGVNVGEYVENYWENAKTIAVTLRHVPSVHLLTKLFQIGYKKNEIRIYDADFIGEQRRKRGIGKHALSSKFNMTLLNK